MSTRSHGRQTNSKDCQHGQLTSIIERITGPLFEKCAGCHSAKSMAMFANEASWFSRSILWWCRTACTCGGSGVHSAAHMPACDGLFHRHGQSARQHPCTCFLLRPMIWKKYNLGSKAKWALTTHNFPCAFKQPSAVVLYLRSTRVGQP
jgi:hypothetical protein